MKSIGYRNIKIYNGGIKDWKKSGYPIDAIEALPVYKAEFMTAGELLSAIRKAEAAGCADSKGKPILTILDLRDGNFLIHDDNFPEIKTSCVTIKTLLDNLKNPDLRVKIPREGMVVSVSETGNRDVFAIRYLSRYGYRNIKGLRFGMRSWIKHDYPLGQKE